MTSAFKVGDIVGESEGKEAVLIKITEVEETRITAIVVATGSFFSATRLTGSHGTSKGFVPGEALIFTSNGSDWWNISVPPDRPWFILKAEQGVKKFEHYR